MKDEEAKENELQNDQNNKTELLLSEPSHPESTNIINDMNKGELASEPKMEAQLFVAQTTRSTRINMCQSVHDQNNSSSLETNTLLRSNNDFTHDFVDVPKMIEVEHLENKDDQARESK